MLKRDDVKHPVTLIKDHSLNVVDTFKEWSFLGKTCLLVKLSE